MNFNLSVRIALRYLLNQRQNRFATFVALLSLLGIAIGVAALITVSTIMQSLQGRLKEAVLVTTPHILVQASSDQIPQLLDLNHVIAAVPYIEGDAVIKKGNTAALVQIQGMDANVLKVKKGIEPNRFIHDGYPQAGSFKLIADAALFNRFNLALDEKVKFISTLNARYTPAGLAPVTRNFILSDFVPSLRDARTLHAMGAFSDIQRFLRPENKDLKIRLWLDDPMNFESVEKDLNHLKLNFNDWRSTQGEFFSSVAMEKLSMTVMLCLIVIVAAFNILSALSMTVASRVRDIAVLKTLGMNKLRILWIFMAQGLILGGCGVIAGTILGIILSLNSNIILNLLGVPSGNSLNIDIDLVRIAFTDVAALLLSLACTLYPAFKASSADAVTNLTKA